MSQPGNSGMTDAETMRTPAAAPASAGPTASTSAEAASDRPPIDSLVLDAAPILTQQPLRGMASKFYMPPLVLAEIKDKRAKEHLEFLRTSGQIDLEVREPTAFALAKVIAFAKLTGDYAVLSAPDLQVLALTYALEVERHGTWRIREQVGGLTGQQKADIERRNAQRAAAKAKEDDSAGASDGPRPDSVKTESEQAATSSAPIESAEADEKDISKASEDKFDASHTESADESGPGDEAASPSETPAAADTPGASNTADVGEGQVQEQDEDDDDDGEWITAENISKFKQLDLGIVQSESSIVATVADGEDQDASGKKKAKAKGKGRRHLTVACMTADYAVQNVLLQMGLSLVSSEGLRITKVKSWVLRCHACFKICKDMERKFCPSCGNPTLLRISVTTAAPGSGGAKGADSKTGGLQIHLKKNFQYHNRGTIYSLPQPKAGTASSLKKSAAKHSVPILREDQVEWERAVARQNVQKRKEERALARALEKGKDTLSARYEDPDWMPDMLLGEHGRGPHVGLPALGVGRKNPNERRRTRK